MVAPIERRFDLALSHEFAGTLAAYAATYRHLIERLGVEATNGLWNALPEAPDALTRKILSQPVHPEADPLSEAGMHEGVERIFASTLRGVTAEQALAFLRGKPPFVFIADAVPSVQGVLSLTTYEWLHLFRDARARIAEQAIARYGKAAEFMIYDALLGEAMGWDKISGEDFMRQRLARYQTTPETPNAFSSGLDITLVRGEEREIVAHVTACEWARYHCERHPSVGYLLACSLDDPMYRLLCDGVRFQRRSTLMEGGRYCEFCFYRIDVR
jgi:hypothetical protein